MPIVRLPEVPQAMPLGRGNLQTRYTVRLSSVPSAAWRAAFLAPPARLSRPTASPALARVELDGARVLFEATPPRLHYWLRWIDRWAAYANSVVAE